MKSRIRLIFILFTSFLIYSLTNVLYAQTNEDELPCKDFQDQNVMLRPLIKTNTYNTKLGPIIRPFASYKYIKYYDSCTITCLYTTFKLNQSKIRLLNFCQMKRRFEWNTDSSRNANSKTDFFTLRTGDTLSFFRRFNWNNPIKQNRDYTSLDTLSYSVELISYSDNKRLILLDSIMVPLKSVGGKPIIYSINPIIYTIKYIIPESLNNKSSYLRINSYQRGNDNFYIVRKDEINVEDLYKSYQTPYFDELLNTNKDFIRITN